MEVIDINKKIPTEKGHKRNVAIDKAARKSNNLIEMIDLLIEALYDSEYEFCEYEDCVKSIPYYLNKIDLRLLTSEQKEKISSKILASVKEMADDGTMDIGSRISILKKLGYDYKEI